MSTPAPPPTVACRLLRRCAAVHPALWLLVWAAAHVAARVWISPALELDEGEQMLWSQTLALGYGAQPPLYTWLQWAFNTVLGPSVLALSTLKFALLSLTFVAFWQAARLLMPTRAAWWVSLGLMWLPALGWESLRDLTHTVLVSALVACTWWACLRQLLRPSFWGPGWIGACLGLGMLSKYSFGLFALALGLAMLSLPQGRQALWRRGAWLLPAVALLLVLPHAWWLLEHVQEASRGTLSKLQVGRSDGWMAGLWSLGRAALANVLLWLGVALLVFGSAWWRGGDRLSRQSASASVSPADPGLSQGLALLWRYHLALLGLLVAMVVWGDVANFKPRWLHPLLLAVPLLALAWRPDLAQDRRGWRYTALSGGLALALGTVALLRLEVDTWRGRPNELNEPIADLAAALRADGFQGDGLLVASRPVLAGMLRLQFPRARVAVCERAFQVPMDGECVAALQGDRVRADLPKNWWAVAYAGPLPQGPAAETGCVGLVSREFDYYKAPGHQLTYRWGRCGGQPG